MVECKKLDYIVDIAVLKDCYLCHVRNITADETWQSRTETLEPYLYKLCKNTFDSLHAPFDPTAFCMEERFFSPQARAYIKKKNKETYCYVSNRGGATSVGLFITFMEDKNDAKFDRFTWKATDALAAC